MRWARDSQHSLGSRLRTLLALCLVAALVVSVLAEATLRGSIAAPSWLNLGGASTSGASVPPPAGEPAEPELATAKKGKGHKQKADKKNKQKQNKDKGKKQGKHKGNNHKGDKKGKQKGSKKGKHKGDKGQNDKGKKHNKHKGNKKEKGKNDSQKKSGLSAASLGAPSVTLNPIADAKVSEAKPTLNYGTTLDLLVDGAADPDVESYLLFDVSGISPPIHQATLRLRVQSSGGSVNGPEVRATGTSWTESNLTWNTRPAPSGGVLDDKGAISGSTWVEYNVTTAVSDNGQVAFVLLPQSNDGAVFESGEAANPPELVITYGELPPTPTPEPTPSPTPTPPPTPTPTPPPATSPLTLTPVADGRVNEASPNVNYGNSAQLLVDGAADPDVESYLRFDVSGVSPPVHQATLRLRVQPSGGTVNGPEVRATGTGWSETGLTWNNRPSPNGGVLDDKGSLSGGTWVEYNVTAAVSGDGSYGFVLLPQSNDGAVFDSREATNPPELVIIFGELPPTPTPAPTSTPTPTPTPNPTPTPTPPPDPNARVVMAAGDNVCGADSTGGSCKQVEVSDLALAADPDAVLVLGDVQYECGEASDFTSFYDPSWGRGPIKSVTRPTTGNHEYRTSTDPAHSCFGNPPNAQAYFDYFGAAAGQVGQGYYSFDLGDWHLIALNSNCGKIGGCGVGSPQWDWLTADLAAHPNSCTLAYWHAPLYSSGGRASPVTQALYQALYDANADLVLTGHDHTYERFAPQDANAQVDNARGIRQFVVGTGGRNLTSWGPPAANSEVKDNNTFGVLKVTLLPNSYDWQFVHIPGESFTDSGSTACH